MSYGWGPVAEGKLTCCSGTTDDVSVSIPPPSPPVAEYDISVAPASPSSLPRGRGSEREEQLLSPEIRHLPPPRTPASTRSRHRDNSSEYYTAAWGSPYERSLSPTGSARTALSEQVPSEDQLESSPIPSFGLEHLVPSRLGDLSLPRPSLSALGRSVTEQDTSHTPRSRTRRWVQLPQRQQSERSRWWSDGSHGISDEEKRHRCASSSVSAQITEKRPAKSHKAREDNRTLNQQSFLETLRDEPVREMASLFASRWADTPPPDEPDAGKDFGAGDIEEKALPELPNVEETAVEMEKDEAGENANEGESGQNAEPDVPLNQVAESGANVNGGQVFDTTRLEPPRIRKRISWRGKNCIISMPDLDFDAMGLARPMSSEEINKRLKEFEDNGYDTRGFDIAREREANSGVVHVKPIYPDEHEARMQGGEQQPKVSLPDLNKWRAYTDWLLEQKLAALGVSTGLDEPQVQPAQDTSRQSSGQYPPLPFSPPISTGSAGSIGRPGMMRGHSHTMSVASPMSPGNGHFGHMHRHSTFTGPFGFPQLQTQHLSQQSQQAGVPGMQPFSPQKQFQMPGFPRGGSPAQIAALRPDLGAVRGPGSPLSHQMFAQSPQDYSRALTEDHRRRQHGYSQSVQHPPVQNTFVPQMPSVQQTPNLPELPEENDEDELQDQTPEPPAYVPPHKRAQINADVAVPTPTRGHRHNPSEGLERDVLEAEQRHEVERRNWIEVTEEDDRQPTINGLHKPAAPRPQSIAENDPIAKDLPAHEAKHGHKKSASRFNVAAPSFNFNPTASFKPTSTAFTFGTMPPKANGVATQGHARQASSGSFNVAAPAFRPANASALPKSDFSFSTHGPTFKPNASAVEPANATPIDRTIVDDLPSIFGKVNIPGIVKPPKKSKAIAIVRPDESARKSLGSSEEFEDDEGRIAQSEDRLKRQRFGGDDGDEVPRFAEPTPMPDAADFAPRAPSLAPGSEAHEANGEEVEAEAAKVLEDIADKGADTVETAIGEAHAQQHQPVTTQRRMHGHKPSTSLSAFARPFEPGILQQTTSGEANKAHNYDNSISELEDGEIKEDETTAISPIHSRQSSNGLTPTLHIPQIPFDDPTSERINNVAHPEPSFDEIDAVMRQLNEAEAGQGERGEGAMSPLPSLDEQPIQGVTYLPLWARSDAPSPSPTRKQAPPGALADSSFTVHERTDSGELAMNGWPHVHRLNKAEEVPTSDWSGMLSPPGEEKLHQRSIFFDSHIGELLGRIVESKLQPLEESLRTVRGTVNGRARPRDQPSMKRSSSAVESDADDEDDLSDAPRQRPISHGRDKRADDIKAAVLEALQEQSPRRSQSSYDIADLHSALADMKISFARAASASLELDDIRAVVEDVLNRQSQAVVPIAIDEGKETHRRAVSELEGRLNETLAGALEEANHRRAVEEREAETRRLLRLAEEELQLLRDSSRDDDGRLSAMEDERQDLHERAERAEEAQRSAEQQVKSLEAETEAMQGTLDEYRLSSTKWRQDIDGAKHEREELENTIAGLERQMEDAQESSSSMRRRLEKLHSDMATAAGQLASEKGAWKAREDDYRSRCDAFEAQRVEQALQHHELEAELRNARASLVEMSEARHALDQTRASNATLDELIRKLQADLAEQQSLAARFERDFHDAKEAGRSEVHRIRVSLETDIEIANHQVNVARIEWEGELLKVRTELENVKMEAETAKARHERLLDEEDTARREALRKVNLANSVALDEARQKHDAALQDLAAQHARATRYAVEDKQRSEYILSERLALSEAKLQHSHDRILHLEERLEVAKSAAQAAVMSAQAKGAHSMPVSSGIHEKVSPQALRESILVLQEQLQEREARIDRLQNQVDKEGPATLKERDAEITWLRELLAVRGEDLVDLVNTLSKPAFDRDTVRDTAIRIRANLQMEQQEKERFGYGPQSLGGQALASLSSFATPKAVSLTSAFNKWRSTMESSSLRSAPRAAAPARSSIPSKASASTIPPAYMVGLMTPPASNLRNTPSPEATMSIPPPQLHSRNNGRGPETPPHNAGRYSRQVSESSQLPITPLFRDQSYDRDAEDSKVQMQSFEDEDLNVADSKPPAFRSLEAELETSSTGETAA